MAKDKKTLLLVEDEILIAMEEKRRIKKFGYKVITANSGEAAVKITKENREIDLILMDIDLGPGIDGTEAAEIILKELEIPILFLSNHTEPAVVEKTEKITSYGYVVKNSGMNVLQTSIKMAFKLFEAHRKLHESEQKYRDYVEMSQDLIWECDSKGCFTYLNPAWEQVTGYKLEEMLGRQFSDFTHQDEIEKNTTEFAKHLESGFVKDYPSTYISKSGSEVYLIFNAIPLYDFDKNIIGTQGSAYDITEHKLARDKLLRNQYYLKKAQEIGRIGTWELDLQTNKLTWTEENYNIFGVPQGTAMNYEFFLARVHPEDRDYVHQKWSEALEHVPYDIEHRLIVDGTVKWVREKADVDFDMDGKPLMAIGFTQEITERKVAEEKLRESEERFRSIVMDTEAGYFFVDKEGILQDVNNGWAKMYGYNSPEEVVGQHFTVIQRLEDVELAHEFLKGVMEGNQNFMKGDFSRKLKDGSTGYHSFSARPVTKQGAIIGIEGFIIDITRHKEYEEEIKRQLSEKEIILKEVHHRIRNNFGFIGSLLSLHAESLTDPKAHSALMEAKSRVNSMRMLYDKLLLSDDYQESSIQHYLENLADEIVTLFSYDLDITVKKEMVDFPMDPKRLFHIGIIVTELLSNSMKHAFEGRKAGIMEVLVKENQGEITIIVRDNGKGYPRDFDMDTQKGFGLMLVEMLSQQLNGTLKFEGQEGATSTLTFRL